MFGTALRSVPPDQAEEQRLADHRLHRLGAERLGDEKGRLGTLPGKKALRKGGDEDHRHREALQNVVHGIDARAAIGQLDVRQNQSRPAVTHRRDRLGTGPRHAEIPVAEAFDQAFQVHGDEGLVLDDQHVGRHLLGDVAPCLLDQPRDVFDLATGCGGDLRIRKAFECRQQERDAGWRRQRRERAPDTGGGTIRRFDRLVERHRIPNRKERLVERDARLLRVIEPGRIGDQGLQRGNRIGISTRLVAGERACEATQIGQMWRDRLGYRHRQAFSGFVIPPPKPGGTRQHSTLT